MRRAFTDFRKEFQPQVEMKMMNFLKQHCSDQQLEQAALYSLEAGGKRIRPLLMLATVAFCQKEISTGMIDVAAALEMVHTYSLIHDDLPAMDNDDLRRGKPTNHKIFGDGLAILAGDALLTEAFHILSLAELRNATKIQVLQLFAKAAGSEGMVAGQSMDIASEGKQLDLPQLKTIHARKTGALLEYAVVAGALLAEQPSEKQILLQQYGQHLGLAFQIRDDLLDITGDVATLGKHTQKDEKLGKNTYPALLGIEGAQEALRLECEEAKQNLIKWYGQKANFMESNVLSDILQTIIQ